MLQVDKIVNSIFDSITWLLSDTASSRVWLVDCGDVEPIFEKIGGREIAGVLLTHAHFDHIYGLPELLKRYPNCKINTNAIGRDTLADERLNMSLYHETPLAVKGPQMQICEEGDELPLFQKMSAKVLETPGHHPSCETFSVENYLFTGDAYIPGIKIVTNLPKGNKIMAEQSKERIIIMAQDKNICPGHDVNNNNKHYI
jgi:glyoxylase-like metal-dependent hydrolase (beta-lactamase superfamily II)